MGIYCFLMENIQVFSVFDISPFTYRASMLLSSTWRIWREISNTLNATLRCTLFKNANYKLSFKPADGQSVVCFGKITSYEKGGSYNLNVSSMVPAGIGDMQARFEALKKQLREER